MLIKKKKQKYFCYLKFEKFIFKINYFHMTRKFTQPIQNGLQAFSTINSN